MREFFVGDIIHLQGYEGEYEVVSFSIEDYFVSGYLVEKKYPVVKNIKTGTKLKVMDKSIMRFLRNQKDGKTTINDEIDELLDLYNDYVFMYNYFGWKEYSKKAKEVIQLLQIAKGKA
jgi:hypothetical protein